MVNSPDLFGFGLLSELSPTAFTEIKHCCAYYRWVKNLEDTKRGNQKP
jgi:hypothetical protein